MTFDEKIKKSLEINSKWQGSPDVLWGKVQIKMEKKTPWWQNRPLWLGTAAAFVFLVFVIKAVINPLPPALPESGEEPQFRTFSMASLPISPLVVKPGEVITLSFTLIPGESEEQIAPTLVILALNGEEVIPIAEKAVNLGEENQVMVNAPRVPGSYQLVLQGSLTKDKQVYTIHGGQEIIVSD